MPSNQPKTMPYGTHSRFATTLAADASQIHLYSATAGNTAFHIECGADFERNHAHLRNIDCNIASMEGPEQ
jgi:hypothetical protein